MKDALLTTLPQTQAPVRVQLNQDNQRMISWDGLVSIVSICHPFVQQTLL